MFLPEDIMQYVEYQTTPETGLLRELDRETNLNVVNPNMLSGHYQGRLLEMISHMVRPRHALEIGTYTGYSAICLARGLRDDGRLITLESNIELKDMIQKYLRRSKLRKKIEVRFGNALELIPNLHQTFDLVFIDASKPEYPDYYALVFDKVRRGGFILADNVLWSGKVLEPGPDKDAASIGEFNEMIRNDRRVEQIMLPVRDGLTIARKR